MVTPRMPVLDKFIGDLRAIWAAEAQGNNSRLLHVVSLKFKDTATYVTPVKTQLGSVATIATSAPGSSNVTGEIAATGYSNYMACQTWVSTDTEPGPANQKVIKVSYDES